MNYIELNRWFLNDNKMSISLMNICAEINILKNCDFVYFEVDMIDDDRHRLTINFYTIEDAISFVEKKVRKCRNVDDVFKIYCEMFENKEFKSSVKKMIK